MNTIQTERLTLISGDQQILECAISGDQLLASCLSINIADEWTEFGTAPLKFALEKLRQDENETNWVTYFPVYKAENKLIGSCGFKGKPGAEGSVEIGYEVAPLYRNKGLAFEIAGGLIRHAFTHEQVTCVLAHTLPEYNASTKILAKHGFAKVAELVDPEDGIVWRWELKRNS
jgi:[ribosomal protein S5]-alanine N-acetyltransferase